MKVAITTLGCKTNQFESAAMSDTLGKEGFLLVSFADQADIYIINTCTVTARTDAESRRIIRRAMRQNPAAKIVVTGCYAQMAHEELKDMPGVDLVLGNVEKKSIAGLLKEIGAGKKVLVSDISRESLAETLALETFTEHTRAFLQVQNGCDAFCAYCIVPYARGRSRSVPLPDVVAGIGALAARGFKEVVLTGIHLSGYGPDLNPPTSLLELLQEVEPRTPGIRLRLGSVEPAEISDDLTGFIASSKIICPHLHIPLQSGDDQVLQRMERRYSTAFFAGLIDKLATAIPELCLGLDIIAGFPGETERQFEEGCRFIQSLPVAYLHVFPFSPRPGTPAATMAGQLHAGVVKERARVLRDIGDRKKQAYYEKYAGKELLVLVQTREKDGLLKGLSRNYIPVCFQGPDTLHNTELPIRILQSTKESLYGEPAV